MSLRAFLVLIAIVLVAGCVSRPRAVVVERSIDPRPQAAPQPVRTQRETGYTVVRGDTLYGIAFSHGVDFRELARWNGIAAPYTIYPGQQLRLAPGKDAGQATRTPPATAAPAPRPAPPSGGVTAPDAPPRGTPAQSTPAPATAQKPPAPPPAARPAPAPPAAATGGAIAWRWPTDGNLLTRFAATDPTRQGIDIVGRAGQPVLAAAEGQVVYSGAGLVGYGELVIIKHSDTWLSAYGHNRKRLVAEGERVRAGQQIAEMGRSGASRDMLHFEIRRSGKPVDPLPLLPRR